ncbi:MAG: conjugal transfer protein MobC [Bacteroidota bacterium]
MNTGEDTQGLRKIIDFSRLISIFILAVHFYLTCYSAFQHWGLTAVITDRIIGNLAKISWLTGILKPKLIAIIFLLVSLLGAKGKKDEKADKKHIAVYLISGLLVYGLSFISLYLYGTDSMIAGIYIGLTAAGYLLTLTGGTRLSRLFHLNLKKDIFNTENETFPQEERLLENEYSINLPAKYHHKGKIKDSWINVINPFRALLVAGTPGAGKSYFVMRHIIDQHLKKGFSMFLYDFKYDDLTRLAYNKLLKYQHNFKIKPKFFVINPDNPSYTHRCNPLYPESMEDITDALESARTIMLGLNREWIKKQGDFFVESPVNFLTAIIWYLKKYQDGRYCTLPHVIELMQAEYDHLFAILQPEKEIRALINPFISAWQNNAKAQLEGQIASAKIGLGRLASPQLYWVLNGNDFTLDVNNPNEPKVICVGNNPQKLQTYGAVLSLYISRMIKLVNRKGQLKSSLIFDEFPTIFFNNMDSLIATARSNKVSTTLAVQDFSQLRKDYGKEQADVITGIVGNVISGQVTGDTAKRLSENFGKIMQDRQSTSINSSDTSISKSTQLDFAIPAAKIAALSSGEFVGFVADNPDEKISLKMFHAEVQNDHEAIKTEEDAYVHLPMIAKVTPEDVQANYDKIKTQVQELIASELEKLVRSENAAEETKHKEKRENSSTQTQGLQQEPKQGGTKRKQGDSRKNRQSKPKMKDFGQENEQQQAVSM